MGNDSVKSQELPRGTPLKIVGEKSERETLEGASRLVNRLEPGAPQYTQTKELGPTGATTPGKTNSASWGRNEPGEWRSGK